MKLRIGRRARVVWGSEAVVPRGSRQTAVRWRQRLEGDGGRTRDPNRRLFRRLTPSMNAWTRSGSKDFACRTDDLRRLALDGAPGSARAVGVVVGGTERLAPPRRAPPVDGASETALRCGAR